MLQDLVIPPRKRKQKSNSQAHLRSSLEKGVFVTSKELAAMGVAEVVGSTQNPSLSLPLSGSHNINQGLTTGVSEPNSKPKKICCACPNTKRLRDECIVEHGEAACAKWIEAHLQCLRSEGFKV